MWMGDLENAIFGVGVTVGAAGVHLKPYMMQGMNKFQKVSASLS